MFKRFAIVSILVVFILSQDSCVKNNDDPAWIEVSAWELENDPTVVQVGELTHAFTNVWVYIDDEFVGIFEVPFKIPILKEGTRKITLYPTVLNNGIAATKKIYPFVEPYEINVELVKNQITLIEPITRYKSNTVLTILDFEGTNMFQEDSGDSLASFENSSDPGIIEWFNGNYFGKVELTTLKNRWVAATNIQENLPQLGAEVYLEMDIYCTEDVLTGVLAINGGGVTENPNVRINEQSPEDAVWRKIYIDLKTIISGSPQGSDFEHSFEAVLDQDKSSDVIYIDNIKIVRF
ncbi:MAG: hypothetical protein HRT57_05000 [Crocinitomicaceae bacterium]|nr:hypothetical protein [Crocinitomicaceae bacterium]